MNDGILNSAADVLAWVNLVEDLSDARDHLDELIAQIEKDQKIDEIDLGIQLGHIYGHLNRCWNGRHMPGEQIDERYSDANSAFPNDIMIT